MAHKTLVDGTSYEVTGGRTLVDGTGYDVTGGRTLVDGTGYDVSFGVTWAVYSTERNYTYDGTYSTSEHSAGSSIYMCGAGIFKVSGSPIPYNGTYTSSKKPPWQNSFTALGVYLSDLPYTFTSTGNYLFDDSGLVTYARIYNIPKGTVVSVKNGSNVSLDCNVTRYTARQATAYVKGSTQYDNVTAPEGTYPDNGEQDGKWYVRLT